MKKKARIRAGIIGSGFAASFHVEALRRVYGVDVEIAGVYSQTAKKREAFAREQEINVCGSLDEVLEISDVVHVCTPPVLHEPVAVKALKMNKYPIVEKPFTGYFGDGSADFNGFDSSKQAALDEVRTGLTRLLDAEKNSKAKILYAENWVYAPAIQKERDIIEKTGAQILWMHGQEAHSGSHAPAYGDWSKSGGGSMIGKGCHPLTAALYLKQVEGRVRNNAPIRPKAVSGRIHILTRNPNYIDKQHLRTNYQDIEDFALLHIRFEDDTLADIFASEIILGGVRNCLEVAANNHRTICNINPNTAMQTYNPVEEYFNDVYVLEKIGTKQGWACTSPDEDWFTGYQHEMEAFYRTVACDEPLESDSRLAAATILTIYSAYLSAEKNGAEVEIPQP
ncbi:MAG: Gfo/Idh/MocA family oxidoreductase [bacterium]|nr:Gfo/Idh/MocA family oxidoreductase [bacterium]